MVSPALIFGFQAKLHSSKLHSDDAQKSGEKRELYHEGSTALFFAKFVGRVTVCLGRVYFANMENCIVIYCSS